MSQITNPEIATESLDSDGKTYCAVHPNIETGLRCNRCGRYMCVKCAVKTPVGYRCRECVYEQQSAYFNADQKDYVIAALVSLAIAIPLGLIAPRAGLFLIIFLSIPAGGIIGEIVHRVLGRRRGRYTWVVVAAAIVIGSVIGLVALIGPVVSEYMQVTRGAGLAEILPAFSIDIVTSIAYTVMCAGAAVARLRYGK